jgi:lysozyme
MNAVNLIAKWEGFESEAYRDVVGIWTIGFGHTKDVKEGDKISYYDAIALLKKEVAYFARGVELNVKVPVTQNMFDALTSFTYNLGIGNLKRSTLLRKLNREDYEGAAREFKRWNRAGGKVYRGLTSRRLEEEELFRKDL